MYVISDPTLFPVLEGEKINAIEDITGSTDKIKIWTVQIKVLYPCKFMQLMFSVFIQETTARWVSQEIHTDIFRSKGPWCM